ncbi:hypothetical protein I3760_06G073700 [Carya illinoinensis]|nr:hypothetical protein I3760_06G073700 [Carya illinoinensis]
MEDGEANVAITFNKLTYLELDGSPNLTNFCSEACSFGFPSLEKIIVRCCPEMKTFCQGILSTPKLKGVQETEYEDDSNWEHDLNTTTLRLWESNHDDTQWLFRARLGRGLVFSVRPGKYRSSNDGGGIERRDGETSSSNLDARRRYSLGSYQYTVADSELQVALCPNRVGDSTRIVKGRGIQHRKSTIDGEDEGKKINIGTKAESFSVSKIWQ